jgi:D-apionolactonase
VVVASAGPGSPGVSERIDLRAGPLALEFVDGDLRYLRRGESELVRRVYPTVRDVNWNSPPARLSSVRVVRAADRFSIAYKAEHRTPQLHFRWEATIRGERDGTVSFAMDGLAVRPFRYCRIGLCLLLPSDGYAGSRYEADTPIGQVSGRLPVAVGAQPFVEGVYWPLFPSFDQLDLEAPHGNRVRASFEGDLFEMEDQRNWGDGSFKVYCTPAVFGYPFEAREGQEFHLRVTLDAQLGGVPAVERKPTVSLRLGETLGQLPKFGLGMAGHGGDLSAREASILKRVHPSHLRVDLRLGHPSWESELARVCRAAAELDSSIEAAVFVTDGADSELQRLARAMAGAPVTRILVFHEADAADLSTAPRWVGLARSRLSEAIPAAKFVAGTNGNFAELNRTRPVSAVSDGVCYPFNPQVHLDDDDTLVEALASVPATLRTARDFCGDRPVHVSAITLKPPFNQAATEPDDSSGPDDLPASVDPRQLSPLAAAWTLACIRALCDGGAASATFYETTGWHGLMETEQGSALPDRFASTPGQVFPVYQVFEDLAAWAPGEALALTTSDPLRVDGLAIRLGSRVHAVVANLTAVPQQVLIYSLPPAPHVLQRLAGPAGRPQREENLDRSAVASESSLEDPLQLVLEPYEVVAIDEEACP